MGRRGGVASGASRRRKRDMKQKLKLLLSLPAADNDKSELAAMGVDPGDMDNEMVLIKSLFLGAAGGDVKAFDRIMDLLGKSAAREELALKKQEISRKNAPSNGQLEKLIAGMQEEEHDLYAETAGADETVAEE